jgi:hypothetical protein
MEREKYAIPINYTYSGLLRFLRHLIVTKKRIAFLSMPMPTPLNQIASFFSLYTIPLFFYLPQQRKEL